MDEIIAAPFRERAPTHPGAMLREDIIPATGIPKAEIARMLGISRQQLYAMMNEAKPVSPDMAVRLGKLFGNGPDLWVRMQAAFDTWHAARSVDVSSIPTLEPANENGAKGYHLARA